MNRHAFNVFLFMSEKGVIFLQSNIGLPIAMQFRALDFLICFR